MIELITRNASKAILCDLMVADVQTHQVGLISSRLTADYKLELP